MLYSSYFYFLYMYVYVCVPVWVYVTRMHICEDHKSVSDPLEMEPQTVK